MRSFRNSTILFLLTLLSLPVVISCDEATRWTYTNRTEVPVHVLRDEHDQGFGLNGVVVDPEKSGKILGDIQPEPQRLNELAYLIKAYEFVEGDGKVVKREVGKFIYGHNGALVYCQAFSWQQMHDSNWTIVISRDVPISQDSRCLQGTATPVSR